MPPNITSVGAKDARSLSDKEMLKAWSPAREAYPIRSEEVKQLAHTLRAFKTTDGFTRREQAAAGLSSSWRLRPKREV